MAENKIYKKGNIEITTNHCDEVFIEDLKSGVVMRLNAIRHGKGGLKFTTVDRMDPVRVSNMIGWQVTPR